MQEIDFNIHTEAICFIIPIFFRVEDFVNDSIANNLLTCSFIVYRCILASPVQYSENRIRSNYLPVKFIKTTCQYFWTAIMLSPENSSVAGTEQKADNSSIFANLKSCVRNTPMNY